MKTIAWIALGIGSSLLVACSGDDNAVGPAADAGTHNDASMPDSGGTDGGTDATTEAGNDGGTPPPPTLGAQIDRMGRPAINTATNHAFDTDVTAKGNAKDAYNQNKNPSTWVASYSAEMAKNLAILDAIDGNCGNQAFAGAADAGMRYGTLAGVLADDRLWVKTDATTCTTYLAVEANATGLLANSDCGGRMPKYEVMKETYSLVAIGAVSGVTDGVTPAAKSQVTTFPYLAAP